MGRTPLRLAEPLALQVVRAQDFQIMVLKLLLKQFYKPLHLQMVRCDLVSQDFF